MTGVVLAALQGIIGQIASSQFDDAAKNETIHDLGILAIWLVVLIGAATLLAVAMWRPVSPTPPHPTSAEPSPSSTYARRLEQELAEQRRVVEEHVKALEPVLGRRPVSPEANSQALEELAVLKAEMAQSDVRQKEEILQAEEEVQG